MGINVCNLPKSLSTIVATTPFWTRCHPLGIVNQLEESLCKTMGYYEFCNCDENWVSFGPEARLLRQRPLKLPPAITQQTSSRPQNHQRLTPLQEIDLDNFITDSQKKKTAHRASLTSEIKNNLKVTIIRGTSRCIRFWADKTNLLHISLRMLKNVQTTLRLLRLTRLIFKN